MQICGDAERNVYRMRIKKIISICENTKQVILYYDPIRKMQWISNGIGIYPLQGCPIFDEESFCVTYEINDTKREKMSFRINEELPHTYDFSDTDNFETVSEKLTLSVSYQHYDAVAFRTEFGLELIQGSCLKPFSDYDSTTLSFYIRRTKGNHRYFVVKNGFMLIGLIEPLMVIDRGFLNELNSFAKMANATFYNNAENSGKNTQIEMPEDSDV